MAKPTYPAYEFEATDLTGRRPKRRKRKPSMRSIIAQAKRAGVEVSQVQVTGDGTVIIVPGQATLEAATQNLVNGKANEWDAI